ncbi:hypothetical protein J2X71_006588 [Rhizobium sp. 1399]|nr:hypothetical protein [Rhizobium sp. 1399]
MSDLINANAIWYSVVNHILADRNFALSTDSMEAWHDHEPGKRCSGQIRKRLDRPAPPPFPSSKSSCTSWIALS